MNIIIFSHYTCRVNLLKKLFACLGEFKTDKANSAKIPDQCDRTKFLQEFWSVQGRGRRVFLPSTGSDLGPRKWQPFLLLAYA